MVQKNLIWIFNILFSIEVSLFSTVTVVAWGKLDEEWHNGSSTKTFGSQAALPGAMFSFYSFRFSQISGFFIAILRFQDFYGYSGFSLYLFSYFRIFFIILIFLVLAFLCIRTHWAYWTFCVCWTVLCPLDLVCGGALNSILMYDVHYVQLL